MSDAQVEMLQREKRRHRRKPLPRSDDRAETDATSGPTAEDSGGAPDERSSLPISNSRLGVLLLLGAVTMMFVAFTTTYVARMGGLGWAQVPLPPILWGTTSIMLLSSGTIIWAERVLKEQRRSAAQFGVALTLALGILFVGGQWLAWQELIQRGVYIQGSAHAAFFYLLTAVHVLHIAGGLIGLSLTLSRNRREPDSDAAYERLSNTALYWHFVDGLWVYLFLLLFFV